MFSRRHPYLFFLLSVFSICAVTFLGVSLLVFFTFRSDNISGLSGGKERVGIVEIDGVISDSRDILYQIKQFREAPHIKAIVVRIDSPGGAVGPSQEIYREIRKTIKTKPVIASMGAVAASGGYYIAAGTDGIVASAGTITGSIGVIMGYTNFKEILQKVGLVPVVVKSGAYKDIGSPVRDLTKDERQILQNLVDTIHRQFIRDVAEGRKMEMTRLTSMADGRIFTGQEALQLGFVDRIGNFEDAVEWAGRRGGIEGKIPVVYAPKRKFSLIRYLFGTLAETVSRSIRNPMFLPGYLYSPGN